MGHAAATLLLGPEELRVFTIKRRRKSDMWYGRAAEWRPKHLALLQRGVDPATHVHWPSHRSTRVAASQGASSRDWRTTEPCFSRRCYQVRAQWMAVCGEHARTHARSAVIDRRERRSVRAVVVLEIEQHAQEDRVDPHLFIAH